MQEPLSPSRRRPQLPQDATAPPVAIWCERHFVLLSAIVLALALFNAFFRLNVEALTEWDESLYAANAFEVIDSGKWIDITFWAPA